jgi:hypothetical protein
MATTTTTRPKRKVPAHKILAATPLPAAPPSAAVLI